MEFNELCYRLASCESAIGLMKNLQHSLQTEENWVDGTAEKLSALPTATSAHELDVSIFNSIVYQSISFKVSSLITSLLFILNLIPLIYINIFIVSDMKMSFLLQNSSCKKSDYFL